MTQPAPASVPAVTTPAATNGTLVAFVKEAVAYAQSHGKEAALAEFSNRNGSFFRGELYIYVYDFNGTTLAHPVNPEMIGVNRLNETDARGNYFIRELRDTALNGSGTSSTITSTLRTTTRWKRNSGTWRRPAMTGGWAPVFTKARPDREGDTIIGSENPYELDGHFCVCPGRYICGSTLVMNPDGSLSGIF